MPSDESGREPTRDDILSVAPAMDRFSRDVLVGELWQQPDLSPRDRSMVTLSALMARAQTAGMAAHVGLALDNGVTPGEISEIVTQLAFYSGWGDALKAIPIVRDVFLGHGVTRDHLPDAFPELLPVDEVAESDRAARVAKNVGPVAPALDRFTTDVLFRDLWVRPGLAPRDRSLVTVSALIASGHVPQVQYHLGRAMDYGLTRAEAAEVVTTLAFYAGWPHAFAAIPVIKAVFDGRPA